MHAMKWSREQAIKYYTDAIGDPEASATTEVERYCVWPGQACAYMVGKLTFLRLRDKAKAALGARFDIRRFHDAVLLCGAVPLTVLETVVEQLHRVGEGGRRHACAEPVTSEPLPTSGRFDRGQYRTAYRKRNSSPCSRQP